MPFPSRRIALFGAIASAASLGACAAPGRQTARNPNLDGLLAGPVPGGAAGPATNPNYDVVYSAVRGEPFPVPAFNYAKLDRAYLRREVEYSGPEKPGTIVVDPRKHFLYLVEDGGRAMRYGVGVGKEGFAWSGSAEIRSKQQWPDWYPPAEMIKRRPDIRPQLDKLQSGIGVPGGPRNPLGARAMYLWQGNHDTLYRIHGTLEPYSIGKNVSSGCIRMINQDAIDLYNRTPVGTKVVVIG